ncbi:MAG TPA: peptidyl-prolyl cis-trans isomerase [Candidatus Angelobacter sp.]
MIRFLQSGNKAAKYILGGFLIILAASMVTYLIPGFMNRADSAGPSGVVASVAGEDIRADQVTKIAQQQLQAQRIPEAYMSLVMPQAVQQAVQQLIQQQEIRYEAGRMGLKAYNSEVADEMQNGMLKQYFYPNGKWIGQQEYVSFLAQNHTTPEVFEAQVRDQVLARKLFGMITAGVSVTPAEVEQAYKDKNLKVKFQYAFLSLADIQKEIHPTEAELKAFYQSNLGRYQNSIPEKRQLRYFVLLDKDAESKVTVDVADIQRYYNSNLDQYRLPDRVKVRHILITTPPPGADGKADPKAVDDARAKAADILKQLKAGGDFAALAKKYSQDTLTSQNGGEVGWIQKGQFPSPEAEKAAFSQSKGQVSDLVQSPEGFEIIQTEDKEQARLKPLAEVKDDIEKVLKAQKASAILDQQATTVQDVAQKQGLDAAAKQAGATVVESNPVGRNDSLPGVGPAPEVMAAVFATEAKAPPQMERFSQGYLVYKVTKIVPPRTPSFEEIKERVTSDFKVERANDLLQKRAKEMADRAHAEHDLAKAAKEAGATLKTSELVGRTQAVPEIGSMSGAAGVAFSLKPGEISGPINVGGKMAVLAVTDRQEASVTDPEFAQQRDALMEQLSERKRQQALDLFMSNLDTRLKNEHKLKIYKTELDRLLKTRG